MKSVIYHGQADLTTYYQRTENRRQRTEDRRKKMGSFSIADCGIRIAD